MSIHYNIHNLIHVAVSPQVPAALRETIDFQISHFRSIDLHTSDASSTANEPARIEVRPYDQWQAQPDGRGASGDAIHQFHLARMKAGRWIDLPASRCAYEKISSGWRVFADTPAMLINMLIQLILAEQGMTMVHAAAAADPQGNVLLLPGPGGVGKTALIGQLVQDHGYKLLGDDIVILSKQGDCYSFPRSFVLKPYHESVYPALFEGLGITARQQAKKYTPGVGRRMMQFAADNMPLKGVLRSVLRHAGRLDAAQQAVNGSRKPSLLAAVPVEQVLGDHCVAARGRVSRVVFLERYTEALSSITPVSRQAMVSRMAGIIHHEWVDHMRHFWTLASCELFDSQAYFQQITRTMHQSLAGVDCTLLTIPEDAPPAQLLQAMLQHQAIPQRKAA